MLDDRELAAIWKAAGALGFPFDSIHRLLILTGQRREEVAGLSWSELDRGTALWTLPAARAKNNEAHLVPLAGRVVALLDGLANGSEWPTKGLVFSTTGKTPPSGFSKAKARLDGKLEGVGAWRVHDLRRTVATGLQRLGVRLEVTEAVLNHRSGSRAGIVGVYQRHDWATEKREALALWSAHLERLTRA